MSVVKIALLSSLAAFASAHCAADDYFQIKTPSYSNSTVANSTVALRLVKVTKSGCEADDIQQAIKNFASDKFPSHKNPSVLFTNVTLSTDANQDSIDLLLSAASILQG